MRDHKEKILRESYNCWRTAEAERIAFLVDAASYFEAFAEAVQSAERSLYIAAWDIDSRLALHRGTAASANPGTLGRLLNTKTAELPGFQTYILAWDFPMMYLREREWLPILNLGWRTHRRVHFHLDDHHPIGASHHQKLVVIDERIAFCGSIDLTKSRWDTPEHLVEDRRRRDANGRAYDPYHEVQILVDGDAASSLGEIFRRRWRAATGKELPPSEPSRRDPWPASVAADMQGARLGIARTQPAFQEQPEIRETEALFRAAIASARDLVYIENQYLTSAAIVQVLAESLSRPEGPEILLVLPQKSSGWLEQGTMDAIRCRLLDYLVAKDRCGRLGVYFPAVGERATPVYVHSKLMIVDDRLAIVGSANLSNRSMGLDTECGVAVEADSNPSLREAVKGLRNRLLAEHLGCRPQEVGDAAEAKGSIHEAIARLGASGRRLEKLDYRKTVTLDGLKLVRDSELLDPEKPMEFDRVIDEFARDPDPTSGRLSTVKVVLLAAVLLAMAAAWRWTPVGDWLDLGRLSAWAGRLESDALLALTAVAVYALGSFVMAPVLLLVGATALVMPPLLAVPVALAGCLASSALSYAVGSRLGRNTIRRLGGKRLKRLNRRLAHSGILAIALVRNLPVAPFTMVNLLAGASHIRFTDYLIGTAIGMLPGIVAITAFAGRATAAVMDPSPVNIALAAGALLVLALGFWWLHRRFFGRNAAA